MAVLKDSNNARKDVVLFKEEDLLERIWALWNKTEKITAILKEKFGQTECELIDKHVNRMRDCRLTESTFNSLDRLENIQGFWRHMLGIGVKDIVPEFIKKNLDKILQHVFMSEGVWGSKISAEQTVLITEGCKQGNTKWQDFWVTVKKIITDYEKVPNDSHFVRDDRGRSPNRWG